MHIPLRLIQLKHLVLVSFLISLIPFGLFVWQSTVIQKNVSLSWQKLTDSSIKSVRISVELNSILVEIERSTKQNLILQTESTSALALDNITHYQNQIAEFISVAPDTLIDLCIEQKNDVKYLEQSYSSIKKPELNELLSNLRINQSVIMNNLWNNIDYSQERQVAIGLKKQKQVALGLLGVSLLTFLILLVLSSQIATPVNILKKKISQLGKDKQNLPAKIFTFNGPKELLEINIQLDRLTLRLAKLEMLRLSFLRHASHEFKTPLASIMEGCAILNDKIAGPLTPTQTEVVGILEDSTQNLKHLTEQLLDYNYLLQNSEPQFAEYDAKKIVDRSIKRYEQFFIKRQQLIAIELELTIINTDSKLFTRIIDNLLSNAQAYGYESGKVLISLYEEAESNILIVANTGPKVPENEKNNILEPFVRSDIPRHDSLPGTGLGLSIVRDCAQQLSGKVTFIDIPDFDFAIKIILPSS